MRPQQNDERSPLLRSSGKNDQADAPSARPVLEDATVAQILRAAIPAILITVAFEFSMDFISVAFSQLIEGAICSQKYPDIQDPYNDPICKSDDVQAMLSFVRAWEISLGILPGLLMALPYGMIADKYGPKRVLFLVFLGNIISLGLETIVCESYCWFLIIGNRIRLWVSPIVAFQDSLPRQKADMKRRSAPRCLRCSLDLGILLVDLYWWRIHRMGRNEVHHCRWTLRREAKVKAFSF
jgi:hypothetical protein